MGFILLHVYSITSYLLNRSEIKKVDIGLKMVFFKYLLTIHSATVH